MKIIKHFSTIKEAETYQNKLYNLYRYVRLILFPVIGESGNYIWEVKD